MPTFVKTSAVGGGDGTWSPIGTATLFEGIAATGDGKSIDWISNATTDRGVLRIGVQPLTYLPTSVSIFLRAALNASTPNGRVGSVDSTRGFRLKDAAGTVIYALLGSGAMLSSVVDSYTFDLQRVYSGEIDSSGDWTFEIGCEADAPTEVVQIYFDLVTLSAGGSECNFPVADKFVNAWETEGGATTNRWSRIDEDPNAADDATYIEHTGFFNAGDFDLNPLPEPGNSFFITVRGKAPPNGVGGFISVNMEFLGVFDTGTTPVGYLTGQDAQWTTGAWETKQFEIPVIEALRGSWDLSDPTSSPWLRLEFSAPEFMGSTNALLAGFQVSAVEVCMTNGSGAGGGGGGGDIGPGFQRGRNASILIPLMVQP